MGSDPYILICDDDAVFHQNVKLAFKTGYRFCSTFNGDEALALLRKQAFALVLLDIQMRTSDEGLAYIQRFREIDPDISVVITSAVQEFQTVRDALRLGANDYIVKNLQSDELAHAIVRAVEKKNLVSCNERQSAEVLRLQKKHLLVGTSLEIESLRNLIVKVRESFANVLITGETGTGKELVARSLRKSKADGSMESFVAIDSSTIQSSMAESILFGHEKGAFTGAIGVQKGIFEEADGGVVYFDEVANMPLEIQSKLLRVLEEKEIRRLGSHRVIPLQFRVICATNHDLELLVRQGKFKEDLFQRLNVIPLTVPPLRERREDIPILLEYFLQVNSRFVGTLSFDDEVVLGLRDAYSWPGNVRELSNLVHYVLSVSESCRIGLSDLSPKIRKAILVGEPNLPLTVCSSGSDDFEKEGVSPPGGYYLKIEKFEKSLLEGALIQSNGSVRLAASLLGINRSHLYCKLKEHGLFPGKNSLRTS